MSLTAPPSWTHRARIAGVGFVLACLAVVAAWAAPVRAQVGGDWGAQGHDSQRTGQTLAGPDSAPWLVDTFANPVISSPVVANGNRVFVKTFDGDNTYLHGLDSRTGEPIWENPVNLGGVADSTQPVVASNGRLFTVAGAEDTDGRPVLGVIDLSLGEETPELTTIFDAGEEDGGDGSESVSGTPALSADESRLFVPTSNGTLYAVDTGSFDTVWQNTPSSEAPLTAAAVTSDGNVVVGTDGVKVHIVSADGTQSKRLLQTSSEEPLVTPVALDGTGAAYVVSSAGTLYALEASLDQNNTLWTANAGPDNAVTQPVVDVDRGRVLVSVDDGDGTGRIRTFQIGGGDPGWAVDIEEGVPSPVSLSRFGDVLFSVDAGGGGQVRAVTAESGDPRWSVGTARSPAPFQLPIAENGVAFVPVDESGGYGVRAVGGPPPAAASTPLSFGDVNVGTTATRTASVENEGGQRVSVDGVTITGSDAADFSVTSGASPGDDVDPGETATFDVTFDPAPDTTNTTELRTATLEVETSRIRVQIDLTGTARSPQIRFSENPLDFGDVRLDATGRDTVRIRNTGDAPLDLGGATVTGTDPGPYAVASGATGTVNAGQAQDLVVDFTPATAGSRTAQIDVASNAGTASLGTTGFAMDPNPNVTPNTLDFGGVRISETARDTVFLENEGNVLLTVSRVRVSGADAERFEVEDASGIEISLGGQAPLPVTYAPNDRGPDAAQITIEYLLAPDVTVDVSGEGLEAGLAVSPTPLAFGGVDVGQSAVETVDVQNTGNLPLVLQDLGVTGPDAASFAPDLSRVGTSIAGGTALGVPVRYQPTQGGTDGATLEVQTSENLSRSVTLSGDGQIATLSTNPTALDFGSVPVNDVSDRDTVVIRNTGTATLSVNGVGVEGDGFLIDGDTGEATLFPDEQREVYVRFDPSEAGSATGSLSIETEVGTSVVDLSGTGVAAEVALSTTAVAYDTVRVNTRAEQTLTVTNTGSATLGLSGATLGGDAPGAYEVVSGATATVAPGATQDVVVAFEPTGGGDKTATLDLATSVGTVTVSLSGFGGVYALSASPSPVDFGAIPRGSTAQQDVTLTNTGNAALTYSNVSVSGSSGEFAASNVAPSGTLGPQESVTATLTYAPQDVGGDQVTLSVDTDVAGVALTLDLLGEGTLASEFTISPSSVAFGGIPVLEASAATTVTLTNEASTDLTVEDTTLASGTHFSITGGSVNTSLGEGDSFTIDVRFEPQTAGARSDELVIDVTTGNGPETIQVSLTGTGEAPQLAVPTGTLTFAQAPVGETVQKNLFAINEGTAPLTLQGATVAGANAADFDVVSGDTGTLAPGDTQSVVLAFAPTASGSRSAGVTLESDGGSAFVDLVGGASQGQPTLDPATVSFPTVSTGSASAPASIRLRNEGNAAFDVGSVTLVGSDPGAFRVGTPDADRLLPGESTPLDVTFAPDVGGALEAGLEVQTSAGTAVAALSGRAARVDVELSEVRAGSPVDVTVRVAGFSVNGGTLFARPAGNLQYERISLTPDGSALTATIPAAGVTPRGLDYYVDLDGVTSDQRVGSIASATAPRHVRVRFDTLTARTSFRSRFPQMVSVPATPDDPALAQLLFDDYGRYDPTQWRLIRWDASEQRYQRFQPTATLPRGTSAWLVNRAGETFDIGAGLSADASAPVQLQLEPGWNQIAVPFNFPVRWNAIDGHAQVESPFAFTRRGYRRGVETLDPWSGYFVYNPAAEPVVLRVPTIAAWATPESALKDAAADPRADATYTLRLSAQTDGGASAGADALLGLHPDATDGRDALDFASPPGFGEGATVSVDENDERLAGSFRPTGTDGQVWDVSVRATASDLLAGRTTVQLTLAGSGTRPDGFTAYVLDRDERRLLATGPGAFTVEVSDERPVRRLRVVFGTDAFAKQRSEGVPLQSYAYALHPTAPNPFTDATTIRYSLKAPQDVTVEVFNVLGQRVRRLVDAPRDAGEHTLTWNGRTGGGAPAASGVYFVRLQAGDFTATRKMTLVR